MMTETELEIEFLGGCYNTLPNKYMSKMTYEIMNQVEMPTYTEEELKFADELNKQSSQYEAFKTSGQLDNGPIHTEVKNLDPVNSYGSTDVGDVQHICPCIQVRTAWLEPGGPRSQLADHSLLRQVYRL